jgi:hypothetical protein
MERVRKYAVLLSAFAICMIILGYTRSWILGIWPPLGISPADLLFIPLWLHLMIRGRLERAKFSLTGAVLGIVLLALASTFLWLKVLRFGFGKYVTATLMGDDVFRVCVIYAIVAFLFIRSKSLYLIMPLWFIHGWATSLTSLAGLAPPGSPFPYTPAWIFIDTWVFALVGLVCTYYMIVNREYLKRKKRTILAVIALFALAIILLFGIVSMLGIAPK